MPTEESPPANVVRVRRGRHFARAGKLRWLAFNRIIALGVLVAFIVFFIQVLRTRDPMTGYIAIGLLVAFIVLRVYVFSQAHQLRCPLCHGTVLISKPCNKHRDADRLPILGHTWAVILKSLLLGAFSCMYCGTLFRTKK